MQPSVYQEDILDRVLSGQSLTINAVAGSGKTTTHSYIIQNLPTKNVKYLAFNSSVASTMNSRIGDSSNTIAMTMHSHLLKEYTRLYGYTKLSINKDYFTCSNVLQYEYNLGKSPKLNEYKSITQQVFRLLMAENLEPTKTNIDFITNKYDLETFELIYDVILTIWERRFWSIKKYGLSFDTLINWFASNPSELAKLKKYDVLCLDECQDFNPSFLTIAQAMAGNIVVAAGDPMQSIYGFTGAMLDSFDRVKSLLCQNNEASLPISYRVPKSHVDLVSDLVPHMISNKDTGQVLTNYNYTSHFPSDRYIVLARKGRDLVAEHARVTKLGINAAIDDSTILDNAYYYIKKGMHFGKHISEAITNIETLCDTKIAIAQVKGKPSTFWEDLKDTSLLLLEESIRCGVTNIVQFREYLDNKHKNNCDSANVLLRTIHKAKGSEASHVVILNHNDLGNDNQQEANVKYVGLTRSLDTLILN
jgi:DNA helicase-2/ATP-dependent DNA helicase PcrA